MQANSTEEKTAVNGQPEDEKKENFFVGTKKLLEQYIHDRILLFKLEMSKKAATTTAAIANLAALGMFAFFALVFLSITLGFIFSKLTGSFIWGFAIITALYIVLIVILVVSKKWVTQKVSDAVISAIYSKKEVEKEKEDASYAAKN